MKKIFIPDTTKYIGKTIEEVKDLIQKEYVDTGKYEFAKDDISVDLIPKDNNGYFLFGSVFRDSGGHWDAPYVYWFAGELERRGRWVGRDWRGLYRVVLLEIAPLNTDTCSDCPLTFCSLTPSNSKNYEVFGLTKDGRVFGFNKKWKELK